MAITGKKRSITITVTKTVAGELSDGYPKIYYGTQSFAWNSVFYPLIDAERLATMSVNDYTARLAAFKAYVESQESGLVISNSQTNEPYYTA